MLRHLCIRLIKKTAPNVFLSRFQKPSHFYPTRFLELNYVQPIYGNKISAQFQFEDRISGTAFLATNKNKSLLCINLKFIKIENALSTEETHIFLEGTFSICQAL